MKQEKVRRQGWVDTGGKKATETRLRVVNAADIAVYCAAEINMPNISMQAAEAEAVRACR